MRVSSERLHKIPRVQICLGELNEFPFDRDSLHSCTTVDLEKSFYYPFIFCEFYFNKCTPL